MAEQSNREKEDVQKRALNRENLQSSIAIFKYVKPYRAPFIAGLVFLLLSSLTVLAFPYFTGELVDAATGNEGNFNLGDINKVALILTIILLLQGMFSYGRIILFAIVSEKTMGDIRKTLYDKMITQELFFFEQRRVGELTSRITSDVSQLQDTLSTTLAEFFRQIATLLIGITIVAFTSPRLTLLMLVTVPVLMILAMVFGRFIRRIAKKAQDALANANVVVEETLQSIQVVKAFTNEGYESKRYRVSIDDVVRIALQAARYRAGFVSFVILALFGAIVLVLWYGASLVKDGSITIGELTSFLMYTIFIGGSVGGMGDLYSKIQKTLGASDRLIEILESDQEVEIHETEMNKPRFRGSIKYSDVHFAYPSRPDVDVLKGINIQVESGRKIALVGSSGAGKSTIIQLLMGFYAPLKGIISIDGKNSRELALGDIRANVGIVPQEVMLFGGSIRENIAYGKTGATEEEILAAAEKANALEFIQRFPEGLDTIVGERGVKLSGGQKQRIAIARAILKDPSILILDEATSSLDAESEQLVQEALNELMEDRTTIVIAHRLATIRSVDTIYVLENGSIIEQGHHDELMSTPDGTYANLVRLQFAH